MGQVRYGIGGAGGWVCMAVVGLSGLCVETMQAVALVTISVLVAVMPAAQQPESCTASATVSLGIVRPLHGPNPNRRWRKSLAAGQASPSTSTTANCAGSTASCRIHLDHSSAFLITVELHFSDWRSRKSWLAENGIQVEGI